MTILKITNPDYNSLIEHLLQDAQKENMALIMGGYNEFDDNVEILVKKTELVQSKDLLIHARSALELKPDFYIKKLNECKKSALSLMVWHSHPFCKKAHFSSIDNNNDLEHALFFKSLLPHLYYGNVVVAQKDLSARIFSNQTDSFQKVDKIKILY